jgi:hypothetical protein
MNGNALLRKTVALAKWSGICVLFLIWALTRPLGFVGNWCASWALDGIDKLKGKGE